VCDYRSISFVSYRQCVTCVAEAVVGLLYLKSHYSTTIGVVGLEPKAALFVLILIIVRPSFAFFSYLPVWLLVALALMYRTAGTSCTSGMAKRRKTAVHSVSLQLAERSLPLAAGTCVVCVYCGYRSASEVTETEVHFATATSGHPRAFMRLIISI